MASMLNVHVNLLKFEDVVCPYCQEKEKYGIMRAVHKDCSCGSVVYYQCMEGCVFLLLPHQIKEEWKVKNQVKFEK